ncbi:MAG: isocitrate lyase/PEP mutase family protein [Methanobacterium sp.]
MNKSKELKNLLISRKTLIMPDAYDPISAKLIEKSGFKAIQCSGYSFSIVDALKREIDISKQDNVNITGKIVDAVDLPVMADAEDGFGGPNVVLETVRMFMDVGVAGLNIEDQKLDQGNKIRIINEEVMVEKIYAAREAAEVAENPDFIINGRTDALGSSENRDEALNIAVERANLYLKSGADIAFVPYVKTLEEVKTLKKEVRGPISIAAGMPYNINNFSIKDLENIGVSRVSLPTLLIYSSLESINKSLNRLKNDDIRGIDRDMLYKVDELNLLLRRN